MEITSAPKTEEPHVEGLCRTSPGNADAPFQESRGVQRVPVCRSAVESVLHALVTCHALGSLWTWDHIGVIPTDQARSVGWWNTLCDRQTHQELNSIAALCWAAWHNRNQHIWHNKWCRDNQVIRRQALDALHQWPIAQTSARTTRHSCHGNSAVRWTPPTGGFLKCNFDTGSHPKVGKVTYGFIIKDNAAMVLATICGSLKGPNDAFIGEILSCREALSWLKEHGLTRVQVATDSLLLTTTITSSKSLLSNKSFLI